MKINGLKVLGVVLSVGGAAIGLANTWLEKRELDAKITEKVAEAFAKKGDK